MRRWPALSKEVRQKLESHRPRTIGQAGRIDGMTPAALTLLAAHVRRGGAAARRDAPDRARSASAGRMAATLADLKPRRPRARAAIR